MWRIAGGYLALSLAAFDALSPREFQWRLEQAQAREFREFERLAQLACWVINLWLKPGQQLKAKDLIGGPALPPPPDE